MVQFPTRATARVAPTIHEAARRAALHGEGQPNIVGAIPCGRPDNDPLVWAKAVEDPRGL
ncbi:MAG: hypothetical protein ABI396_16095 [Ktedonobacteraceae bacterium]